MNVEQGWIEHDGGKCPIAAGVPHYRRYRDGAEEGVFRQATGIQRTVWQHKGDENDIIAYRIVDPNKGDLEKGG